MNFLTHIQNRYTTKMYSGEKLSEQTIATLQEILRLTPSSINSQPWIFSVVSSEALIKELAKASYFNQERIEQASHLIVLAQLQPKALIERFEAGSISDMAYAYFKENVLPKGESFIDQWTARQVYIALGVLLSACATMEVDATPMEGIDNERYNQILELSNAHTLVAVAIGKRHPEDKNQLQYKPKQRLSKEEVIREWN